ncbi:hypothetical protein Tco_0744233, partial [Tanacetum coccineum]
RIIDSRVEPVIDDDVRESIREDVPDHVTVDGAVEVTYETLRGLGHRIVATSQQSATMSERIGTLERDNVRLRGMLDVERQRVDLLQRSMSHVQRDLRYQVKYATCTLLDGALTWWSSHKRTVGVDDAYAMTWKALMKLMTEMVPKEEDKVEKYIGGLPDSIQGNVIAAELVRLQDAIRIANNLMDQKLKGYAIKNAENKRRFNNNSRDNRGQQQAFKRQNVNGQNVARAYTVGNNVERRGYVGALLYCNKCILHYEGPYTVKCGNYKRVGHMTRDYRTAVAATSQRAPNHKKKTVNKTRNNEAKARAFAIRGGGANPDSNIITCTFILNNRYDSGADRSFVSTTFSALLDVIPSTLDTSYAVELADGRI